MRRLPVYLLLDTSGSMYGEPIAAVENGIQVLLSTLRQDPYALETAFLSIITFDDSANQVTPLTEIAVVDEPELDASGCTALGEALSLLANCIKNEVKKTTESEKGDWKPIVFIMTDGIATDDLDKGINDLKQVKCGMIVACAAGNNADTDDLKKITENVVQLDSTDSNSIKAFFKWVSASVSVSSTKIEKNTEISLIKELPPPPSEVNILM